MRKWIKVIAVVTALNAVAFTWKALNDFRNVGANARYRWLMQPNRGVDDAIGALTHVIISGTCVAYLVRTRRSAGQSGSGKRSPIPWRKKLELRLVIYSFAILQLIQFPLGLYRADRLMREGGRRSASRFIAEFPPDDWIRPLLGTAVLFYDRRCLRRDLLEQRRSNGQCLACGYDLRASPDRCPECGTLATANETATDSKRERSKPVVGASPPP